MALVVVGYAPSYAYPTGAPGRYAVLRYEGSARLCEPRESYVSLASTHASSSSLLVPLEPPYALDLSLRSRLWWYSTLVSAGCCSVAAAIFSGPASDFFKIKTQGETKRRELAL